ncbi:MAG: hypothetical protein AABX52_03975 [Nanoarchaeota archaeon]
MALKSNKKGLSSPPVGVKSAAYSSKFYAALHKHVQAHFSNVEHDKAFVCGDGVVLGSVWALAQHLRVMNSLMYSHHVNDVKNDFAVWLRDVHAENGLANRLLSAQDQQHASKIIANHVVTRLHEAAHG